MSLTSDMLRDSSQARNPGSGIVTLGGQQYRRNVPSSGLPGTPWSSWGVTYTPITTPAQREAAAGLPPPPAAQAAATASSPLQVAQAAMAIGEPIPVVFTRRRGTVGGVLVFPKATEARFSNDATTVSSRYHLVVSEGRIGSVQRRDVRCGECRIGSYSQNYSQRAGTWTPGNFATVQTGYTVPTFPSYTGGGGNYEGLTTLEAGASFPGGLDDWRTGWNMFIRDGIQIDRGRLLDSVVGSSDSIADLALWALQRSSRVPDALIDLPSLQAAALFCEVNGLWCNGEFGDSTNLGDWLVRILPYFLLRETRVGGKYGLRPLLPTNANGTIKTTAITPDWVLTETVVIPESLQIDYTDAATRRPPIFQMLWRQQDDDTEVPIPRTLAVGDTNSAGPFEQHDLSQFATTELHAARVGAYRLARRTLSTHTATVKLRPGTQTGAIREGDTVQLYLQVESDREAADAFNHFYVVENVGTAWTGEEQLTLSHLPVDSTGRSLIALAVAEVSVSGVILPSQRTGTACDLLGASTDTTVPASSTSGKPFIASTGGGKYYSAPAQQAQWIVTGGDPIDWWAWMASRDFTGSDQWSDSPPVPVQLTGGGTAPPEAGPGDPGGAAEAGSDCPLGYKGVEFEVSTLIGMTTVTSNRTALAMPTVTGLDTTTWSITYRNLSGDLITETDEPGRSKLLSVTFVGYAGGCVEEGSVVNPSYPVSYTVQPGDTLWGIAEKYYGDGSRWPEIYAANLATVGSNPDLIFPGQVFSIPAP